LITPKIFSANDELTLSTRQTSKTPFQTSELTPHEFQSIKAQAGVDAAQSTLIHLFHWQWRASFLCTTAEDGRFFMRPMVVEVIHFGELMLLRMHL